MQKNHQTIYEPIPAVLSEGGEATAGVHESSYAALSEFSAGTDSGSPWQSSPILRRGHEIEITQTASNSDTYTAYIRLNPERWSDLYNQAEPNDSEYTWRDNSTGKLLRGPGTVASARTIHDEISGTNVALLSSKQAHVYDGLVVVTVPKTGNIHEDTRILDESTDMLIGEQRPESYAEDWLRAYYKLPEGSRDTHFDEIISQTEPKRVSPHHIAPVVPGLHATYTHERSGTQLTVRHEVRFVDDVVDMISDGSIAPTLERLKRGQGSIQGRSSGADLLYGGADSVFGYFCGSDVSDMPGAGNYFVCNPEILDRLDVRAYEEDAYGSRETTQSNALIQLLGRQTVRDVLGRITSMYDGRVEPTRFGSVAGVHEVCFEKEIGINECAMLVLHDDGEPSHTDFRWGKILQNVPYEEWHLDVYGQSLKLEVEQRIKAAWGDEAAVRNVFAEWAPDIEESTVEHVVTGMNLPLKERILARLHARGIDEINGRPAEAFILAAE